MPIYVQHEILGKVNDVFNAEAIWQAPGLALFARRPLLRDLLERSPRELRGRAPTRCFSHVTLLLAQEELDDDRHLTRGARVRDLTDSLTALHRKDFGDLLGGDEVRYDVIGTEALAPGEVEVRFGHAVYLPAPPEPVLYKVSMSADSAIWQGACVLYQHQRLALLSEEMHLPAWPFGGDGAILLVNDGPDTPIEVQVRPKGAFDCSFDAVSGYYTISRQGPVKQRLLMKIERAGASVPMKPATVWKSRSVTPAESELTAVPFSHRPLAEFDATFAPIAQQRVSLVALALPRLSRYRDTGTSNMEIGLNGALGLAADTSAAAIRFAIDGDDNLCAITAAGSRQITAPATFSPVDHVKVELLAVPPAMADRYCATLLLKDAASLPVASGARLVFGRSAPMLAALRILDSARFLQRADGAPAASADRLGLSRNAFSFEATSGGYKIGRISPTQALFHLDEKLDFVACIADANADQPYLLPAGHHLVAGHYVLRFDV
ncbi:MAG: hypothetical protein ACJ8GW_02775 [Massilia sp.]